MLKVHAAVEVQLAACTCGIMLQLCIQRWVKVTLHFYSVASKSFRVFLSYASKYI